MFDRWRIIIFERFLGTVIFLCGWMTLVNFGIGIVSLIWNPEIPSWLDDIIHGVSALILWICWTELKKKNPK